jgi:uncharacterized protein involved in cysteine biosynthesis
MGISALVFLAIVALGYVLLVPRIADLLEWMRVPGGVAGTLGVVIYGILWWFAAGVVFLGLAGFFSSLLWEKLSLEVERKVKGSAPVSRIPIGVVLLDSASRMIFSMSIAVMALLFGFWCIPIAIVLAGWLALYDYTAPAFLRRGVPFSRQFRRAFRCKGWKGFALSCGILTLLPVINMILMPGLVAGGTIMCAESEGL